MEPTGQAVEPGNLEAARRSLTAALDALRELQAMQHQAERLVRRALESMCQLAPTAPDVAVEKDPFLPVVKVAEILGVSQRQARQMVKDGAIPSVRLGQRVVVPRASLEGWVEEIDGQGLG